MGGIYLRGAGSAGRPGTKELRAGRALASPSKVDARLFPEFGRVATTSTYGSDGDSTVSTFYGPCGCSPLGKISQVSEPYATNGAVVWTTYSYDGIGRTTKITQPDGSATTYSYLGNTVTVTDPAGKWKQYYMDAFGNLTVVVEPNPALLGTPPPASLMTVAQLQAANSGSTSLYFVTAYTYDILNHLTGVSMVRPTGNQNRSFNYASNNVVGPYLLSATNPENGMVIYTYQNGLLHTKTDYAGHQFTYNYDSFNRLTSVTLAGQTQPLRTYNYDRDPTGFSQNALGRLVSVTYPGLGQTTNSSTPQIALTDRYSYVGWGQPGAGLPSTKRLEVDETLYWSDVGGQHNPTITANFDSSYAYNNEGKMTSITYPSTTTNGPGPTYSYTYDGGNRLNGIKDALNNPIVSGVSYFPSNQIHTMTYSGITETRTYNNLWQLTNITAGTLNATYSYTAGSNVSVRPTQVRGVMPPSERA